MMKLKPLCAGVTADGGIKMFDAHLPMTDKDGSPLKLNLRFGHGPDGTIVQTPARTVTLHLCERCKVAFVSSEMVEFAQASGPVAPQGGSA